MNRENKRKQYEKGYYKPHACNETFVCKVCGRTVVPQGAGSDHSNHCPTCLSSLHVDIEPGDRAADCICGALSSNRIAADDNPMKLMSIAMKPLCSPPFPIERIRELTALMGGDGALE